MAAWAEDGALDWRGSNPWPRGTRKPNSA